MIVGICQLTFLLPGNRTLKGKRQIVRKLSERIRNKFHVSVAEVGAQDRHQEAKIGVALVSNDARLLNSMMDQIQQTVEFMQLVSRRLNPGGIFCLYSNGSPEQAFAIRETADSVFPYRETFFDGYLVILSNDPIHIDEAALDSKLQSADPLWTEVQSYPETATAVGR